MIEFSCPADISVSRKVEEKVVTYGPLIRNLQLMFHGLSFKIVVGGFGTIPNTTKESLKEMKCSKIEINKLLRKLQNRSVTGTVNICKMFMKFSESWCMALTVAGNYPSNSYLLKFSQITLKQRLASVSFEVVWLTLGM